MTHLFLVHACPGPPGLNALGGEPWGDINHDGAHVHLERVWRLCRTAQLGGSKSGDWARRPNHTLSAHTLPVPSAHNWRPRWLSPGSLSPGRQGRLPLSFGHREQGSLSTSQLGPVYPGPGASGATGTEMATRMGLPAEKSFPEAGRGASRGGRSPPRREGALKCHFMHQGGAGSQGQGRYQKPRGKRYVKKSWKKKEEKVRPR